MNDFFKLKHPIGSLSQFNTGVVDFGNLSQFCRHLKDNLPRAFYRVRVFGSLTKATVAITVHETEHPTPVLELVDERPRVFTDPGSFLNTELASTLYNKSFADTVCAAFLVGGDGVELAGAYSVEILKHFERSPQ